MIDGILGEGLDLMLYGMGTVIVFLTLMIFATELLGWVVRRFPEAEPPKPTSSALVRRVTTIDGRHHKAIEEALKQHLKK